MSNTITHAEYFCASCEEKIENDSQYQCKTCCENDVEAVAAESFCDSCIPWHIKKGHSIVDWKGFDPAICTEHKQLCLEYCVTCEIIFCSKCLGKHRMHDFKPLHEKASEVRSQVHQYLTDWETKEKHILKKRSEISWNVQNKKKTAEKLITLLKEKTDRLQLDLTEEIQQKLKSFQKIELSVQDHGRRITDLQAKLRNSLGCSNGPLVSAFQSCKQANDALSKVYLHFVNFEMNRQNFAQTDQLDKLFECWFDRIKERLVLPQVRKPLAMIADKRASEQKLFVKQTIFVIGCFTENGFIVRQANQNEITIYRYKESGPDEFIKTLNIAGTLQRVFFQGQKFMLFHTETTASVYHIDRWNIVCSQNESWSNLQPGMYGLYLYYMPHSGIHRISWQEREEHITVQKLQNSTVGCHSARELDPQRWTKCFSKPENSSNSEDGKICFYDQKGKTLILMSISGATSICFTVDIINPVKSISSWIENNRRLYVLWSISDVTVVSGQNAHPNSTSWCSRNYAQSPKEEAQIVLNVAWSEPLHFSFQNKYEMKLKSSDGQFVYLIKRC